MTGWCSPRRCTVPYVRYSTETAHHWLVARA